jgi:hypothetical protein
MAAIVSVIAVVLISMLINRFATIALALTGMSREEAKFQARAAMSGVGLTTPRAEDIVAHPVRRRIVFWLMIVGSAGIVTGIASLVLSFHGGAAPQKAGILVGGLFVIWLVSRTGPVDRALTRAIGWVLTRRGFGVRDYGTLLDLTGDYAVAELSVRSEDWLAGQTLRHLRLRDEGVVVIGIHREGSGYIGAPGPEEVVTPGDTLVVYGQEGRIAELDRRQRGASGDEAHARACRERSAPRERRTGSAQRRLIETAAQVGHRLEHGHRS